MRLQWLQERVVAQFTIPGEVSVLAEHGENRWLPLYSPQNLQHPIAAIHSTTHEVRLFSGQSFTNRQVVVLGPAPLTDIPT
jgi:hypothetical protein